MNQRPLPPVIGATENALRALLTRHLQQTAIEGFDEWDYLTIRAGNPDEELVNQAIAEALRQPLSSVAELRSRLRESDLLNADGSLTAFGIEQLTSARAAVSQTTTALTADIDPNALQTTTETLDIIRARAERELQG